MHMTAFANFLFVKFLENLIPLAETATDRVAPPPFPSPAVISPVACACAAGSASGSWCWRSCAPGAASGRGRARTEPAGRHPSVAPVGRRDSRVSAGGPGNRRERTRCSQLHSRSDGRESPREITGNFGSSRRLVQIATQTIHRHWPNGEQLFSSLQCMVGHMGTNALITPQ